uniref:Uncharacterized protein n=1 Tax=Anguilla anguilla TaxID=7936 RepID=A0A0E9X3Y4_ANGAN
MIIFTNSYTLYPPNCLSPSPSHFLDRNLDGCSKNHRLITVSHPKTLDKKKMALQPSKYHS